MSRFGLNDGYRYLAAQVAGGINSYVIATTRLGPGWHENAVYLGGDLGYVVQSEKRNPPLHPHFPYGAVVVPDR